MADPVVSVTSLSVSCQRWSWSPLSPVPRPKPRITRGDDGVGIVRVQFIARDLLFEKPIIGLIAVKRIDDIVSIAPGAGTDAVVLEFVGIS